MTYANGAKYDGQWKNDKRHGQCTFTNANGEYHGEFKDNKSDEEHTDPDYYMIEHIATTDDFSDERFHEPAVTATKCRSMMSKKRSSSAVNDDAAGTNKKLRTCIKPSESASEKKEAREKEAREKEAMEKEASEPEESGRESGKNTPAGQHGEGWNALMRASYNGHAPVVSILVRHGADMEVQDSRTGYTALMLASVTDFRFTTFLPHRCISLSCDCAIL